MKENIPPHLEEQICNCVESSLKRHLGRAIKNVQAIGTEFKATEEDIRDIVGDANRWIKMASGDVEGLYDEYKYRVFLQDNQYVIVWGKELDLDE